MTHLSLFTGIGGLDLAAEWAGFETVGQCEWAEYPTRVLEKHWPHVQRWKDVREVTAESFRTRIGIEPPTILSAGFPCQPHSLSGKRNASGDERDLWPEVHRIICEIKPKWFVGENVPGLLSSEDGRFFGRVLRDLALGGYCVGWVCLPAHAVGAPFWGKRVAIVAASDSVRLHSLGQEQEIKPQGFDSGGVETPWPGQSNIRLYVARTERDPSGGFERNDDGVPTALDRLRCLGNAVVPQQFYPVFAAIAQVMLGEVV